MVREGGERYLRDRIADSHVLVVGDLNVDLVLTGLREMPELGREIMMEDIQIAIGGSCGIFSAAIAALGMPVRLAARVGDDYFGQELKKKVDDAGVDISTIVSSAGLRTGVTVCLSYPDERAQLTYAGAMSELCANDLVSVPLNYSHLHVSSYYLLDALRHDLPVILKTARDRHITVSLDSQGDPRGSWDGILDVLPYVDLFLPNLSEALAIAQTRDVEEALVFCREKCPNVAIKIGEKGSLADLGHGPMYTAGFRVNALDPTGAGDCFDAALVYALMFKNLPSKEALAFANAYAALSVTRVNNGSFPSEPEAEQFLARMTTLR